jgi:hypothetical protein
MPENTAGVIRAIDEQFALAGTEGLVNPAVYQTPQVAQAGGLAALEARLAKTRPLKQGMMQELLTWRVRLV